MDACPYCQFELNGPANRQTRRNDVETGGKSTGDELVTCPNCGGVIDGFAAH